MLSSLVAVLLVADGGASADAPENTLPAFELAWKQGADAIAGDFRLTKDGRIACIRNADTEAVAGRKLVVTDSTMAELKALDVGIGKGSSHEGARIPSLKEVLAIVPKGKQIHLEIKCGPEIIPALRGVLDASDLQPSQVVVTSLNADFLKAWKPGAPRYRTLLLVSFERRSPRLDPSLEKVFAMLEDTAADGLSTSDHPAITTEIVNRIKAEGYEYHVWTINDAGRAARFLKVGAESLTTARPGALRSELGAAPRG